MSDRNRASTFAKGLQVLRCFEEGRVDMTMADVARLTGFDRATTRRLCLTLEETGYLSRIGRGLRLTPQIMAVAGGYLTAQGIGKTVQPVLNHVAEELQGEVALALRHETRAIYVARSAVPAARLSIGFSVGNTLPLLPTAVGRMLLAQCADDTRAAVIAACEVRRHTDSTELDRAVIADRVEEAARQGFAYAVGEFETGAAGIAVPVPRIGAAEAVLSTTAASNQLASASARDKVLGALRRAAMSLRP